MKLSKSQRNAALKLYRNTQGGAVWHRVGTGKTRTAYKFFATVAKYECEGRPSNFLVVCRREAFADWTQEIQKCGLDWQTQIIETVDDIPSLINPPFSTVLLVSHGKLHRLKEHLLDCAAGIQAVAFDEGYLYKNSQSQHGKTANAVSKTIGRAIILSGSVMTARNLEDIYGQLYAVNRHEPLAKTLTAFRSRFQVELQIGNSRYSKFVTKNGSIQIIKQAIRDRTSFYFPSNNQRQIIESVTQLEPSKDQRRAIARLKRDYYLELKGKDLEIKNTPSLIIKCQQISDGWLKMQDGTVISLHSEKLDFLVSRVNELLNSGEKIVIWCAFRQSVTLVLQRLQKEFPRVGCYSLTGGFRFNRSGWMKNGSVCVGTEASGSSVNFLKDCSYAIYYSMDFRWLSLQQSQGRTNRKDSAHSTCFYYFLQTVGSLDGHVYKIVRSSSREERKLIETEGIKSWLEKAK